jgi:hypothetical protein
MRSLAIAVHRPSAQIAFGALTLTGIVEALYYAAHSLWLGISLANPMPYFDQWYFVLLDYFRYLDGRYSWIDLFSHHNEHRIVTTRLVLFADALFFKMGGVFPIAVAFAALALIGAIVATLATERGRWLDWTATFLIGLGLLWSTCQSGFTAPFQVCFPLLHLLVLISLVGLAFSIQRASMSWLTVALMADFLAVFSLASGPFVIIPATLIALWMGGWGKMFWLFAGLHAFWTILYFGGGFSLAVPYTFEPITFAKLVVLFIGLPFGAYGVAAGLIGLSWSLALALRLSWQSVRSRTSDPASVVMVSLAGFVVIEAALVAIGREGFGVSGRYTTAAIVFWVALLAATWRMAGRGFFLPLLAATMIMTVPANDPNYEAYWRLHASFLDRVTREVKAGEFKPASMKDLLPAPFVPGAIRRLQALHVGPFRQ